MLVMLSEEYLGTFIDEPSSFTNADVVTPYVYWIFLNCGSSRYV